MEECENEIKKNKIKNFFNFPDVDESDDDSNNESNDQSNDKSDNKSSDVSNDESGLIQ